MTKQKNTPLDGGATHTQVNINLTIHETSSQESIRACELCGKPIDREAAGATDVPEFSRLCIPCTIALLHYDGLAHDDLDDISLDCEQDNDHETLIALCIILHVIRGLSDADRSRLVAAWCQEALASIAHTSKSYLDSLSELLAFAGIYPRNSHDGKTPSDS